MQISSNGYEFFDFALTISSVGEDVSAGKLFELNERFGEFNI